MTLALSLSAVLLMGVVFAVAVGILVHICAPALERAGEWLLDDTNDARLARGVGLGLLVLALLAAGSVAINAI